MEGPECEMANNLPEDYQRKHSSVSCGSFESSEGCSICSESSGYSSSSSCYKNSDVSSDCSYSSFSSTTDFDHDQESEFPYAHLTFDIDDGREESKRLRLKVFDELKVFFQAGPASR